MSSSKKNQEGSSKVIRIGYEVTLEVPIMTQETY